MPWNLLFIECSNSNLKEPGNQVGRQELLTATMAGCPNGWPGLSVPHPPNCERRSSSEKYCSILSRFEREKSISCLVLQGKISRGGGGAGGGAADFHYLTKPESLACEARSPSCTRLTKYRCKIRDSIHQEKPKKSWRFCCFDSGKSD
ncbi:hypothetical protein OIU79_010980 [Salix purpurea]|uniref:Uncharacterized protein n=1 Tax=Salix purpurea TaxID=77065 RepID=A0A9Q0QI00_SALPP|nr:hypothetical protein OIU79_010980 [Salix purpurea]